MSRDGTDERDGSRRDVEGVHSGVTVVSDVTARSVPGLHDGEGAIDVSEYFRNTESGVNFHVWELAPGVSEGLHTHEPTRREDAFEEIYYVISGEGVLDLPNGSVPLSPGVGVLVPVGVDHGVTATGDEPLRFVLVFALVGDELSQRPR